jgi:tRNA1Val (adenine37-N6)-methyltransferase
MLTLDSIRDIKLYQSKEGYRFSVDALLLFSFVNLPRAVAIADLGAGSGIIGILLARKYPDARVTLIELQESLVRIARKNVELNDLTDRVRVLQSDIRFLTSATSPHQEKYDLIVSNPPFRRPRTGLISLSDERALARHELALPLEELVRTASQLLRHHGRFCLVYLPERLFDASGCMRHHALEPKRVRFVHSTPATEAKMVLIEAVKGGHSVAKVEAPLFVYNEDGSPTPEMRQIYATKESDDDTWPEDENR